ncbi:MAG: proline--tRNA ligase [Gammaproteobacteria bacterium]|nr:proline--tRNA ligase [Gammaproteobacteria bacterium]MCY4277512.1 proline--tRNA ligase [Gammaproteobacteria bacterium]
MRVSQFPLFTLRGVPADAETVSHRLMLRAGLIRQLTAGVYSWLPLGVRVLRKVETILREELDKAGSVEISMPTVQPRELWDESGRWEDMGPELLRFKDRHERDSCLGPTHEEVITDIFRREIRSYRQLPCNFYQIQTKFRDEIRPRYGVMRAREFVMKDAYSFHASQACFDRTYRAMFDAYSRILDRAGLEYRAVEADSGAIGGAVSHEFHVLAESGEDSIVFSTESDYAGNVEKAEALAPQGARPAGTETRQLIDTPGVHTIDELVEMTQIPANRMVKTLIAAGEEGPVALILRGDHQLNEIKAAKLDGVSPPLRLLTPDEVKDALGVGVGSLGPVGLKVPLYIDRSAWHLADFSCGANIEEKHFLGVNWDVDMPQMSDDRVADIRRVVEGDPSPDGCGELKMLRGIEAGHVFQLGVKYSKSMNASVQDETGGHLYPLMGCYGFGVTRIVAAAIEQCHDDEGIVWPPSLAPFHAQVVTLGASRSEAVAEAGERIYSALKDAGVEVLIDDRDERPGVKLADADLVGIPWRIVVGQRNLAEGKVECVQRTGREVQLMSEQDAIAEVLRAVKPSSAAQRASA